jgi:uncharacterized protein (DUF1015 family)
MARFEPFPGIRYDPEVVDPNLVTAPPYDVLDASERDALLERDPHNIIAVDLPVPPGEDGSDAAYEEAGAAFQQWQDDGVLITDEPSFYAYRMGYTDEAGRARQVAGIIGALELTPPDAGNVLPHEQTTPKAKTDRLRLYRATGANLSAVWGLSPAEGLGQLAELPGPPVARWTDDLGVHHRLWQITQPGMLDAISSAVGSQPVVIADGHHRYATALQHRDERHEAGEGDGPWDLVLAFVVELAEDQLDVQPIHRVLSGVPDGLDLVQALEPWFDVAPDDGAVDATVIDRMVAQGTLTLVTTKGAWSLTPRPEALAESRDLDSSRLDVALAGIAAEHAELGVAYQHGVDRVQALVDDGTVDAGVLLRPATVGQILEIAHGGERMPPKTTFFSPKPSTGQVFRSIT